MLKKLSVVLVVGISLMGAGTAFAKGDYVIKKGDTLYSIAKKHDMSVDELKELNGLKNNTIKTGNSLTLNKTITVKKGDTLYRLAKNNGTTVNRLKEINGLTSNLIYVNQKLIVKGTKTEKMTTPKTTNDEFSMKLEKNFTLEKEEPGKSILLYNKNNTYFVRIENLGSRSNMDEVKNNAKLYLQSTGKAEEMKAASTPAFYKGSSFHFHAFNKDVQQKVVVKIVDGNYVKFTIHYPNKEEAEGVVPNILNMLNTLHIK